MRAFPQPFWPQATSPFRPLRGHPSSSPLHLAIQGRKLTPEEAKQKAEKMKTAGERLANEADARQVLAILKHHPDVALVVLKSTEKYILKRSPWSDIEEAMNLLRKKRTMSASSSQAAAADDFELRAQGPASPGSGSASSPAPLALLDAPPPPPPPQMTQPPQPQHQCPLAASTAACSVSKTFLSKCSRRCA